jgi:cell division protein ZipA
MAEELRLALILLGSLAIGAVVLHGIWTVRKNVQPTPTADKSEDDAQSTTEAEDEEIQILKIKQMEMDFNTLTVDSENEGLPVVGMDVDSIYHQDQTELEKDLHSPIQNDSISENQSTMFDDVVDSAPSMTSTGLETSNQQEAVDHVAVEQDNTGQIDNNVLTTNDEASSDLDDIPKFSAFDSGAALDNVNDGHDFSAPNQYGQQSEPQREPTLQHKQQPKQKDPEVFILFVDKPEGEMIDGARLLPLLLTLGFKFGEMDFFHRHKQTSGHGDILFSLANMYNPGTFDIDRMEQVQTRGLSIFMTMPNAGEALQTFNMMHNAAKKIADEFGARVLDYKREPLDIVRVRHYVEKIRKF